MFEKKALERVNPQHLQKADSGKAIISGSWGEGSNVEARSNEFSLDKST